MGMIDRKNVIDELNTDVLPFLQHHCDMQCCREKRWISKMIITVDNAIAMLKEQEARILDWDELEDWRNAVWFEDKDEHKCYIALIANVGTYDAKFTNVEPGNIHSLVFMRDFYMKEWRCWSARPTIKQRQAVKWE